MKWSVMVLILLGFVAALSAALMTMSLRARAMQIGPIIPSREAQVLVAKRDLPAMSALDGDSVETHTLSRKQVTEDTVCDATEAIGKILTVPVLRGQALNKNLFTPEGSGARVVMRLLPGMRAVTLSMPHSSCLEGILYPGCRVDVLSSFKLQQQDKVPGEALSSTLLENVQVLAIENRTVGTASTKEDGDGTPKSISPAKNTLVTLMVDSRQAKALQLAVEYGAVSLALRHPGDSTPADRDATLLNQGKLAQLASLLEASVSAGKTVAKNVLLGAPVAKAAPEKKPSPPWQVEIIRGSSSQMRSFPVQ